MTRLKLLPWAIGVCLLVGTLAGANRLLQQDPPTAGGNPAPPPAKDPGTAVVVTGTVAAEQDLVAYAGSPFLPAARVAEVYVKEGDEVPAGKPLYKFDDANALAAVAQARASVEQYKAQLHLAEVRQRIDEPHQIRKAEVAVEGSKLQRDLARQAADSTAERVEKDLKAFAGKTESGVPPQTPAQIAEQVKNNPDVLRTKALLAEAETRIKAAELDLEQAKHAHYAEQVQVAAAAVKLAQTAVDQAKLVADECVIKAKVAGTVERLEAAPGVVVGPTTRTPLLWLVPTGPRVVRAEVEPEFAQRVQNKIGQRVVITDHNNTSLTYEGEIQRVSSSFLPKRSAGAEFVVGKPTVALEVIVAVKDPNPPGKPPLRVGQPVRVSIGQ